MAGGNSTKNKSDKSDKNGDKSEKAGETADKSLQGTSKTVHDKAMVESMTAAITASMKSGFAEMSRMIESSAYEEEYEEFNEDPGAEGFEDDRLGQEVAAKRLVELDDIFDNSSKKSKPIKRKHSIC